MEPLRDPDGSYFWPVTADGTVSEIDPLDWQEASQTYLDQARGLDPEASFSFMEDYDGHGNFLGFWALRRAACDENPSMSGVAVPLSRASDDLAAPTHPLEDLRQAFAQAG